jgi:hypothetical protein
MFRTCVLVLCLSMILHAIEIVPDHSFSMIIYPALETQFSLVIPPHKRVIATVHGKHLNQVTMKVRDGSLITNFDANGGALRIKFEPSLIGRQVTFLGRVQHKPQNITFYASTTAINPIVINRRQEVVDVSKQFDYYQFSSVCTDRFQISASSKHKFELIIGDTRYPNHTDKAQKHTGTQASQEIVVTQHTRYFIVGIKSTSKKCIVGMNCDKITINAVCLDVRSTAG